MKRGRLIKVCGMMHDDNIRGVERLGVDMMGFIFYSKSPRNIIVRPDYLPSSVKRVGVFVDANIEYIKGKIEEFELSVVQLHGDEEPSFCVEVSKLKVEVIKAFQIASRDDIDKSYRYDGVCDYLLFDTQTESKGGSGRRFDWQLLSFYRGRTPFILSGGISPDCIDDLGHFEHPMLAGYDLNSRFEECPGRKSVSKLKFFINKLRAV